MKEMYTALDAEVIRFMPQDVITASNGSQTKTEEGSESSSTESGNGVFGSFF